MKTITQTEEENTHHAIEGYYFPDSPTSRRTPEQEFERAKKVVLINLERKMNLVRNMPFDKFVSIDKRVNIGRYKNKEK